MKNALIPAQEFAVFGDGKLFVVPTHARDIVVVEGSVLGGPNMLPLTEDVIPGFAATLLDAGTATKDKAVIREGLAARGMSLSFSSVGDRTGFSGRCFPEDLTQLLAVITECLGQAAFPEAEVATVKAVTLGDLEEEKSDTRAQAERAFAQMLYEPSHPNYLRPLAEDVASVQSTKRADLVKFKAMLGTGGLVLVIAGDVEVAKVRAAVEKTFGTLGSGTTVAPAKHLNAKAPKKGAEQLVNMNDKANVDVLLGMSLPLTVADPLYRPLYVLIEMLGGGGFSSHLMQTIRERDGLTYGVSSRLAGFTKDTDGSLKVWATFSPDRYIESVAALRREIAVFFAKGITPKVLAAHKERLAGSYLVSLATTQNLASTLHAFAKNGYGLAYLTEYPEILQAVTFADLKKAAALIPLDKLSLAASGTFPKN